MNLSIELTCLAQSFSCKPSRRQNKGCCICPSLWGSGPRCRLICKANTLVVHLNQLACHLHFDLVDASDWHAHKCPSESFRCPPSHRNLSTGPCSQMSSTSCLSPIQRSASQGVLLNEILLPANLHQHTLLLVGHLIVASLLATSCVAIHLSMPMRICFTPSKLLSREC